MKSARQAAQELGVSVNTVLRYIGSGRLHAVNYNKGGKHATWRISQEEIDRFLERRQPVERIGIDGATPATHNSHFDPHS